MEKGNFIEIFGMYDFESSRTLNNILFNKFGFPQEDIICADETCQTLVRLKNMTPEEFMKKFWAEVVELKKHVDIKARKVHDKIKIGNAVIFVIDDFEKAYDIPEF